MAVLDGKTRRFSGVFAPVITPFGENLSPDAGRLITHCRWMLSQGVGLSVFGTNSEANSLSADEKIELMDALVGAGIDPKMMMPGTGCCAITETARLTAHATRLGCGGVLMLPPFYYKGVSDEGLFAAYADVIQRVGSEDLRIYLYHIPPAAIVRLYETWQDTGAEGQQQQLNLIRDTFGKYVVIPALKACTGHFSGDARWDIVRPPLTPMGTEDKDTLISDLNNLGFGMPGLMAMTEPAA